MWLVKSISLFHHILIKISLCQSIHLQVTKNLNYLQAFAKLSRVFTSLSEPPILLNQPLTHEVDSRVVLSFWLINWPIMDRFQSLRFLQKCLMRCMYVGMYVYVYIYMYICMYIFIYICIYIFMNELIYVCIYICLFIREGLRPPQQGLQVQAPKPYAESMRVAVGHPNLFVYKFLIKCLTI